MNLTDDQLRSLLPKTIALEYPVTDRKGNRPDCFWLNEDMTVTLSTGQTITIERGFVTDFASVPGVLWGIFRPIGDHNLADVVHDWLYTNHIMSRAAADAEFLTLMRVLRPHGRSWLDNHLRYLAVRWFGQKAYSRHGQLTQ